MGFQRNHNAKSNACQPLSTGGLSIMRDLFLLALLSSGQAMSTREAIQRDMEKTNNDIMCWGVENVMAYRLAQYEAMEECARSGLASGMVRPTNPFPTLPGNLNNPFADHQKPLNRLFNNDANSRNPLSALLSRNSIGNSAQHAWDSLFRSRRASEEGLLEIDEAAELEKFLEDYDEFKTDVGSMIGNLTCVLTKMDMLDSALQVNLKAFTTDIWKQMNLKKTLAPAEPGQEPHHQGLRPPHDLLQVRHETREENVRDGSDARLADHPLRQQ